MCELSFRSRIILEIALVVVSLVATVYWIFGVAGALIGIILIISEVTTHYSEREFWRKQLFEALNSILQQIHSPVMVKGRISYCIWSSKSDSEKTRLLGAKDFALFEEFVEKLKKHSRVYADFSIESNLDRIYGKPRREIIKDIEQLVNAIPWLKSRKSKMSWPSDSS